MGRGKEKERKRRTGKEMKREGKGMDKNWKGKEKEGKRKEEKRKGVINGKGREKLKGKRNGSIGGLVWGYFLNKLVSLRYR